MSEQEYIPVESAREQMCVSPSEMLMLLEAGALRCRKDRSNGTVKEVSAEDVRGVTEYLTRFRQEKRERLMRLFPPSVDGGKAEDGGEAEAREVYYFNISDTDLLTLLLAAVSYFDAERDLYFMWPDERGTISDHAKVASKLYGRLEEESRAGRPLSEIVEDIYEQRPDQDARRAVYRYLMSKVEAPGKGSRR